jgi:glycosyltransferase involved in cell wall biosynthesis
MGSDMKKTNVLILTRYGTLGASSRVRCYQYLPYLRDHGFNITVAPLLDDHYLKDLYAAKKKHFCSIICSYVRRLRYLLNCHSYDLLWIEKELFPWLPAWLEELLAQMKIPYIVEYDDAVFHRYDIHPNGVVRILLGGKIDTVMRRATLVIAGNEYLAKRARMAGAMRVEQLPSVIDLARYPIGSSIENPVFTIGWIGTPVTAKYLYHIHSALAKVCQNNKARVVLVGSGPISLNGVPTEIRPWSEETEVGNIRSFDVGIMPLPDFPWERGKCGYKLIQYMACSKPVVASPVGVNMQIVESGINGFLASTKEEWVQALSVLQIDNDLRKRMSRAGRSKIEEQYCIQATATQLMELLLSASN